MEMMQLIARKRYVWTWRMRYWWLDTESGRQARIGLICIGALFVILDITKMIIAARTPAPAHEPVKAVIWWVVWLIVAIVLAIIAVAIQPKRQDQKPTESQGPTTEDGKAVVKYWGTHWISDEFLLAWKVTGRDPIKAEGGK